MSLKSERQKRKITTQDIADHTGISRRTIEAYENGQRDIRKASYDSLAKIAKFLGVPIERLIEGEANREEPEAEEASVKQKLIDSLWERAREAVNSDSEKLIHDTIGRLFMAVELHAVRYREVSDIHYYLLHKRLPKA